MRSDGSQFPHVRSDSLWCSVGDCPAGLWLCGMVGSFRFTVTKGNISRTVLLINNYIGEKKTYDLQRALHLLSFSLPPP